MLSGSSHVGVWQACCFTQPVCNTADVMQGLVSSPKLTLDTWQHYLSQRFRHVWSQLSYTQVCKRGGAGLGGGCAMSTVYRLCPIAFAGSCGSHCPGASRFNAGVWFLDLHAV
jgi:hypothetical protein